MKRIVLLGPIAKPGVAARGGYQSSNLRLMRLLGTLAPDVEAFRYPETEGSPIAKAADYAGTLAWFMLAFLQRSGRDNAIHFTPLFRQFIVPELIIAAIARARGYRVTIDIRAGSQATHYRKSGPVYRWLFRRLLAHANVIAYEGETYRAFVKEVAPERTAWLLPNYVDSTSINPRGAGACDRAPRLIYVGAISEAKGVPAALRVLKVLRRTYPDATMTLVGNADPRYRSELEQQELDAGVVWTGPLDAAKVEAKLDGADYFVFLTHWFGEGQSNALTEAMARGCVPIVTDHGFNKSVVGVDELVVADRDNSEAIAASISDIWRSGRWQNLSREMTARVSDNYSDRQVMGLLQSIYADPTI